MKQQLRIQYKEIRKRITINPEQYKDKLNTLIKPNSIVAIYYPIKDEINIFDLISSKWQLLLPVIQSKNEALKFALYDQNLKLNRYNIPEPINNNFLIPQYCIVPLLCFDPITKHRIGYGGGYYDRTIKQYQQTIFIGLGHELLKTNIKFDQYDQPLHYVITDQKIY